MAQSSQSSKPAKTLTVSCPDCKTRIVVDAATGAVVRHQSPDRSVSHDFDQLLAGVDDDRKRAEAIFEQEQAAYEDRERLLEAQFEDALDRVEAADDGTPPESPFDLD